MPLLQDEPQAACQLRGQDLPKHQRRQPAPAQRPHPQGPPHLRRLLPVIPVRRRPAVARQIGLLPADRGISVDKLPYLSRKYDTPASAKWYTVWHRLFPELERPRSPYIDLYHDIDQFVQYSVRTLPGSMPELAPQERQKFAVLLQGWALRWRSEQGEPLDHRLILAGSHATQTDKSITVGQSGSLDEQSCSSGRSAAAGSAVTDK
ncbi:hypothetical protein PG990_002080 [Apiospora arundinis]